jgi:hypothetical protein
VHTSGAQEKATRARDVARARVAIPERKRGSAACTFSCAIKVSFT